MILAHQTTTPRLQRDRHGERASRVRAAGPVIRAVGSQQSGVGLAGGEHDQFASGQVEAGDLLAGEDAGPTLPIHDLVGTGESETTEHQRRELAHHLLVFGGHRVRREETVGEPTTSATERSRASMAGF